jgi:murein DD-endopeptidase / murein LD-carboxypeptidase
MPVDPRIAHARSLIGTPFRLHGRSPETGLDCVGLVALIHGRTQGVPIGYPMRGTRCARWTAMLDALATPRSGNKIETGDVLLMEAGPAQYHLGMWTGDGLIHADAGLRKVVETPGPVRWPVLGVWYSADGDVAPTQSK